MYTLRNQYTVPLHQSIWMFNREVDFMDFARIRRDVFPSMHVAISFVVWLYAYRNSKKLFWILSPLILSLWLSTLYLRYHYLIDVVAGLILAPLSFLLANWLFRRWGDIPVSVRHSRKLGGTPAVALQTGPVKARKMGERGQLTMKPQPYLRSGWTGRTRRMLAVAGRPTNARSTANGTQPSTPISNRQLPIPTPAWLLALLLLLAILPYVNTLQNGFVYDDNNEVLTNPYIRSFSHVGDIFSTRILAHLGARGATNYYRPISIFGFLICYKLFGLLPYGFHLANLLLHALIVCVLFGLTKRLFQDQWLAFIAAAIFALHPIHTESVAWVSGVTDLDLAVFYLATFWFFLASARPQGARSEWMQLGMVGSFILALLSKEQAVTLPLMAMIYEHFYRGDRASTTWRQKVSRYGALWLLVVVYVLFRIRFFGAFAPVQLTRNVSWYEAILSAAAPGGPILVEDDLAGSPHRLLSLSQKRHAARPAGLGRSRGAGVVRAGLCVPSGNATTAFPSVLSGSSSTLLRC